MERSLNQIITARLNKCSALYLHPNGKWHRITTFYQIWADKDYISVKFSRNNRAEVITLSYPFQISDDTAYVFGLILGSAQKYKDRLILNVSMEQIPKIKAFCSQFRVVPKIETVQKRAKNRGRRVYNQYFSSAFAYIPFPIYKYMMALGLNLYNPRIPAYFSPRQRHLAISGYLNSKKVLSIRKAKPNIYHRVQIIIRSRSTYSNYSRQFATQIQEELKKYSIASRVDINKLQSSIRINSEYIPRLQEEFDIQRPQIKFRAKFIGLCQKYPHIIRTANFYKLSLFELTVLEIAFYSFFQEWRPEGQEDVEYTRFEEILTYGSNTIRKCLYAFQENGFIEYFAKGKKEFVRPNYSCFDRARKHLVGRINSLKKSAEKEGMLLTCMDCGTIIDYIAAMEGNFCCPACQSMRLQEYSKTNLARKLAACNRELNLFKNSYEVMCNAGLLQNQ